MIDWIRHKERQQRITPKSVPPVPSRVCNSVLRPFVQVESLPQTRSAEKLTGLAGTFQETFNVVIYDFHHGSTNFRTFILGCSVCPEAYPVFLLGEGYPSPPSSGWVGAERSIPVYKLPMNDLFPCKAPLWFNCSPDWPPTIWPVKSRQLTDAKTVEGPED